MLENPVTTLMFSFPPLRLALVKLKQVAGIPAHCTQSRIVEYICMLMSQGHELSCSHFVS